MCRHQRLRNCMNQEQDESGRGVLMKVRPLGIALNSWAEVVLKKSTFQWDLRECECEISERATGALNFWRLG